MTFKQLIADVIPARTETICVIPTGDVDLEKIKKELHHGHYWVMDIKANNTIPELPAELYEAEAAFCAEKELPDIDIVIKTDCDFSEFWITHTRNHGMKF